MNLNKHTLKRISAICIIICVLFASFNNFIPSIIAQNEDEIEVLALDTPNAKRFYGDQLGKEQEQGTEDLKRYSPEQLNNLMVNEKAIYQTLEKMRDDEIFLTGNIDCQISGIGDTQDKGLLLQAFCKARDAFKQDNPDLFYVDFDKINISTSSNSAYLGIGNFKSYLLNGFTPENIPGEISKYEAKINEIVSKAKVTKTNSTNDENIGIMNEITYVHDYLIENMMYKYENECTKPSTNNGLCNHRTAYDGIINQEGVCESYSNSFKAILDRLGIPTINVNGLYKAKETFSEEHMWNYVYWNNAWYGVDVTHDDPVPRNNEKKSLLKTELENRDYFMVSATELNIHHLPSGVLTSIDYIPFIYPGITLESQQTEKTLYNNDGLLKVKLNKSYYSEEIGDEAIPSGDVYVSYQGHSIGWNEKHGKYMVCKLSQYQPGTDTWTQMDWGYITPELYPMIKEVEDSSNPDADLGKGYTKMPLPHIGKIQFAITDIPPDLSEQGILNGGLYYKQDPYLLDSVSEVIENQWGSYIAPPYPKKATPGLNGRLNIGTSYDIKIEYDDKLIPIEGENFGIDIDVSAFYDGLNTAKENCKIDNINFDNDRTITFTFTPSNMFNDDLVMYIFNIKGLKGEASLKRPIPVSYVFAFQSNVGCSRVRAAGGEFYAYGQPKLLANEDISKNLSIYTDKSSSPESIDEKISHRLTLVASQTSPVKTEELKDFVQNDQNVKVESCQTYNIQLNLCKKQILKTGDRVKVCVGFPPGFSKDKIGISFVAYHYITDENNKIIDVEEIPCDVTEQGLVMWVDSFSPFMIAAIDKVDQQNKTLLFDISNGGTVSVDNKNADSNTSIELKDNNSKTIKITPNTGYKIDKIEVNGKELSISPNSQEITIAANDTNYFPENSAVNSALIGVNFITNEAQSHKESRPLNLDNLTVSISQDETNSTLIASTQGTNQNVSYQWYKDDQLINGANSSQLKLADNLDKIGLYKVVARVNNTTTAISSNSTFKVEKPATLKTVTFNPNGGEFDLSKLTTNEIMTDEDGKLKDNDLVNLNSKNVISRVGYTFDGWTTQSNSAIAEFTPDNLKDKVFETDLTLYAVWTKNNNEYLINLNLGNAKLNITNNNLLNSVSEETLININNNLKYFVKDSSGVKDNLGNFYKSTPGALKLGYEFNGWVTSDNTILRDFNTINSDTVLTPSFGIYDSLGEEQDYDIVLNPVEGSLGTSPTTYELNKNDKFELPLPIKDGFYFAGWYLENDSNHSQPIQNIVMDDNFINLHYKLNNFQTHSITLVAYWIPKEQFNVNVYPELTNNSGNLNNEIFKPGHIKIVKQTRDGVSVIIGNPLKGDEITYKAYSTPGFRFKGWYINGKPYNEVNIQNSVSDKNSELTISYDPEIEILAIFEPENSEIQKEYKITLIDKKNSENSQEIYTKDGKLPKLPNISDDKFIGWFTSEFGGIQLNEGFPVISDLTLYAQYKSNNVRISYSVSPVGAGTVKGSGRYEPGTEIELEAVANSGYQFDNWTLDGKVVSNDQYYTFKTDKDIHLVANFSESKNLDPENQFTLKEDTIYLTTLEDGRKEAEIVAESEKPLSFNWISSAPSVANIISFSNNTFKIQAQNEGVCFITISSGNVIKTAKIIVSNKGIVTNSIFAHSNSPDELTLEAQGVMSNPAINDSIEVKSLSIFAWSQSDQSDMNAKQVNVNKDGNWSLTIPINNNEVNNFFMNADKINIHVYAETDEGLELIGTTVYNYSNGDYNDSYLIATPYAQDKGFITPSVFGDTIIGTEGESRQLEGLRLACPIDGVSFTYSVHMADIGWSPELNEGSYAGTMFQNRQLEAVKINLTGENAQNYILQYQAHVADKGWLDWVEAGQMSGTEGEARRLEAIRIRLIKK